MDIEVRKHIAKALLTQALWTLGYAAVLAVAVLVVFTVPGLGPWSTVIILLPLLPALGILRFVMRQMERTDEMFRRNQLVAAAWTFGILLVGMIGWSLLEVVGWPRLPMWINLCVAQGVWIVCIWTQILRYR
jgi:1,4-dihydroxy-2-naphthoate octaprenyltransferase